MNHCRRLAIFAALLAAAGSAGAADDPFRCGNKLIELGMTRADVRQLCGAPSAETQEVQDVRSSGRLIGKTTIYRWTYDSYSRSRVLVFDQDTLKSIEAP